jgi:FKBP-type peptidyl-prolyl cis-trans isomerase 2
MSSSSSAPTSTEPRGDLVLLDYELWSEMGDRRDLIDTTREEVAQQAGLKAPEGYLFEPHPHILGGEYFPSGIESFVRTLPVGEEVEHEFAPADAFGEKDPKLIELFSMHEVQRLPEMRREDAELDIGTVLTIRGRRGRVVSLTAARVRVDFNPAFAGRKIQGKFKIVSKVSEPVEKVRAIVELSYGRSKEFGVEVHDGNITLKVPDRTKFDINWLAKKPRLVDQLRAQVAPKSIKIVEEYVTPSKEKDDKKAASPAALPKAEKPPTEETSPEGDADESPSKAPAKRAHAHAHAAPKDAEGIAKGG